MKSIWKFPVPINTDNARTVNEINLPRGAKILCVQLQKIQGVKIPQLWVEVDVGNAGDTEAHTFIWVGTGHTIVAKEAPSPDDLKQADMSSFQYIGTIQSFDSFERPYVGHLYQEVA